MHPTLIAVRAKLVELFTQVKSIVPSDEPFSVAHNNWGLPGITRTELIEAAQFIITEIDEQGLDEIGDGDARLKDYLRRLEFLRTATTPQIWGGNGPAAVAAYLTTLKGLRKALEPALRQDDGASAVVTLRKLTNRARGIEARLNSLEPRTTTLDSMVGRIESAYNAAEQLPADLEALAEARKAIEDMGKQTTKDHALIQSLSERAVETDRKLHEIADQAAAVMARCESAYSAATSVGLAAAFNERSAQLSKSMWVWVLGLVCALAAGSYFGADRLHALSELFKIPTATTSVIVLNLLLSILSVAAPVWFAWLATKQIGQRFRLAEDYGYKATISRAYEGFRRETARFDVEMERSLLLSALARLDELPLRLVETETHGSPWHELAASG